MAQLSDNDNETREMLMAFVSEALDSLDTNEHLVENLRDENSAEFVNAIFRVFHTIKGLSGFFNMMVINKVTHQAETLLDIVRKSNSVQTEDTISIIYSTFDFLRELLNVVSIEFTDISASEEAEDYVLIIKDAIIKVTNPTSESVFNSTHDDLDDFMTEDSVVDSNSNNVNELVVDSEFSGEQSFLSDESSLISNELILQYLRDSKDLLETVENDLLKLESDKTNHKIIEEAFRCVHSLKGNSGFMGFSEIEEISMDMETILDLLRNGDLAPDENIISILLSNLEIINKRIDAIVPPTTTSSFINKSDDLVAPKQLELKKTTPIIPAEEIIQVEIAKTIEDPNHTAISDDFSKEKEIAKPSQVHGLDSIIKKTETKTVNQKVLNNQNNVQKKDIRVETIKIDKLFDLVGELITIESMVSNNPEFAGLNLPNFTKATNMLNKITRELQEVTMSVRMMPLEGLFNKMKRLVRDVSIKMEKKVDFLVSGQDTEMDKNVIDEIADPLVHILRNALDHGVESSEKRIAKGKNETGQVSLTARYEGNEILIIITDDGGGMNRDVILAKAEEKGLLHNDPSKMSDSEVFNLIFEPGFSTAAQVTDISGRGVGMDVVRKNIEKLRGTVDITSKYGQGSTFTLRIPLTLAIMDSMLVRVGNATYAMPVLSVTESFIVDMNNVTKTMDGLEVIKVRKDIFPIIRLHELFKKKPDNKLLKKGIMIIIESRTKKVCLFVDEIVGQQQAVVKNLTDFIGKVPGITGCMILGDGGIGLILDIESLIELSENFILSSAI